MITAAITTITTITIIITKNTPISSGSIEPPPNNAKISKVREDNRNFDFIDLYFISFVITNKRIANK